MCAVFFDLTKAFDSIWHKSLLDHDSLSLLNFSSLPLSLLHSDLQGCTKVVIRNGSLSSKSQVTSCVPQCSILGPLLLIMYIITLLTIPPFFSHPHLYPDDILLSQEISSPSSMSTVYSNINLIHRVLALVISPLTPKTTNTWSSHAIFILDQAGLSVVRILWYSMRSADCGWSKKYDHN